MSKHIMKDSIEDLLRLPVAEMKVKLTPAMEEIRKLGIGKLLGEHPDSLARLLEKLKHADAAGFFSEVPGAADQLTALLWEWVAFRAGGSKDMKSLLENAERDFHGNIEASDSPFRTHFIMEKGKIRGGSGLLHFKDEDFRFMGPTEVLLDLLTGDLALGLGNLRLQTAGHPGWVARLVPVMREISKMIKGADLR